MLVKSLEGAVDTTWPLISSLVLSLVLVCKLKDNVNVQVKQFMCLCVWVCQCLSECSKCAGESE